MFRLLINSLLIILTVAPRISNCHGKTKSPKSVCNNCCINCHNTKHEKNSCVSGDMYVQEKTKGIVRVSQLSDGDVIVGIVGAERKPSWCKVVAIFPAARGQNRTTYDGFTPGHMVLNGSVQPYGPRGETSQGPVFTLATDCDAAVNVDGQAFTPISTDFCPHELSWSEYLSLIGAIRRVTSKTGNFWFDMDAYHDNETANITHWIDQAPAICREILRCARESQCQEFENVMSEFVDQHLNEEYLEVMKKVFPNLGGDVNTAEAGTITEVVRSRGRSGEELIFVLSAVGGAMIVLLFVAVALLVYRRRLTKKKADKELIIPNQPLVNADELNA